MERLLSTLSYPCGIASCSALLSYLYLPIWYESIPLSLSIYVSPFLHLFLLSSRLSSLSSCLSSYPAFTARLCVFRFYHTTAYTHTLSPSFPFLRYLLRLVRWSPLLFLPWFEHRILSITTA